MVLRYWIRKWLGIDTIMSVVNLYRDAISEAEGNLRMQFEALATEQMRVAERVAEQQALLERTAYEMNAAFAVVHAAEGFYAKLAQDREVPEVELKELGEAIAEWQKAGWLQ